MKTGHGLYLAGLIAAGLGSAGCGDDDGGSNPTCDPAATPNPCAEGRVCEPVAPERAECLAVCDPAAAPTTCATGTLCVPLGGGQAACVPSCDPADAEACGTGWRCVASGTRGTVCRPDCDPAGAACPDGEVCQPLEDGTAVCMAECSPDDAAACVEGRVCEVRTDGLSACYEPVALAGRVFDFASDASIEGARVAAADDTGAAATDVEVTGADGTYRLVVPVERQPDGTPAPGGGTFTLRAGAQGYEPFPHGVRQALPIDAAAGAVEGDGGWTVQTPLTDVGLLLLPSDGIGRGSIAGSIDAPEPGGALVVAEGGGSDSPTGWGDKSGSFVVFNVPPGTYQVVAYRAGLQVDPEVISLGASEERTGVILSASADELAVVSGSIQIVNPGDCTGTSVVLVPESTFNAALARGEVAPGLRAPAPGVAPDITGDWSIPDVPDGRYVVLAGFENDRCVRDPDPGIAGTQIVHLTIPDPSAGRTIDVAESFKVTGALAILSPGAVEPEAVAGVPEFTWEDDSSEDAYSIVVYDAFGTEVWRDDALASVSSGNVVVPYAGTEALRAGMYYQFRATSLRRDGPISMTEDLLGVFFLE